MAYDDIPKPEYAANLCLEKAEPNSLVQISRPEDVVLMVVLASRLRLLLRAFFKPFYSQLHCISFSTFHRM